MYRSFRGITGAMLGVGFLAYWVIIHNSKDKKDYDRRGGTIMYLDSQYKNLPLRDPGKYRYLIVDSYGYPFEIYIDDEEKRIDSLRVGDIIDIYFYENSSTHKDNLNRYVQFIDKNEIAYFVRTDFQRNLGYFILSVVSLVIFSAYILLKTGKIRL